MANSSGMLRNAEDITVVIPAAGRVPEGVLALSNIACPAMIPVAGRPVIHWTLRYLRSLGLRRFVIAVSRRGMFVEDFVDCAFGNDSEVSFLVPTRDSGVGRTVLDLVHNVTTPSVLTVLGDTYFQFADPVVLENRESAVLVNPVEESYRWCIAEVDENERVSRLRDKEPDVSGQLDALIGVYFFPDTAQVVRAARESVSLAESQGRRTEIAPILERIMAESSIHAVRAGDWLDCGNPDRQASSHRALLQKRAFNEFSIDPVLGTITKRSQHPEKFIDEINYLRLLPTNLAVLFPRVLECSTDWSDPWLTMEYYGYPSLAEMFVYENVDPGIWERVFDHLHQIVTSGFMRERRPLPSGAVRSMYLEKTRERLADMQGPPELLALARMEGEIRVNGKQMANISLLWERLDAEVEELSKTAVGTIMHGDLCLSNVLYDLRSRICKLIDPRGSFSVAGVYGDPRYDVAKLFHSIYGLYDLITNDLFRVSLTGTAIELEFRPPTRYQEIQRRFEKVFFGDFDRREILLITGLLFASMPALHYDAPRRQIAMYARALQLFDELFSDAKGGSPTPDSSCASASISTA